MSNTSVELLQQAFNDLSVASCAASTFYGLPVIPSNPPLNEDLRPLPYFPTFVEKDVRKASFDDSPFSPNHKFIPTLTPESMAHAGFFYRGKEKGIIDAVNCFMCGNGFAMFDTTDTDPIQIHLEHYEYCSHLIRVMSDEQLQDWKTPIIQRWITSTLIDVKTLYSKSCSSCSCTLGSLSITIRNHLKFSRDIH